MSTAGFPVCPECQQQALQDMGLVWNCPVCGEQFHIYDKRIVNQDARLVGGEGSFKQRVREARGLVAVATK